jgi:hypothetical protein
MPGLAQRLAVRRAAILAKSDAQRRLLIADAGELKQSLTYADLGWTLLGKLRNRPALVAIAAAAAVVVKPRRMAALAEKALRAWRLWRSLKPLWKSTGGRGR